MADDGAEFSTYEVAMVQVDLKKGPNTILIKHHCGRVGSGFAFYVNEILS